MRPRFRMWVTLGVVMSLGVASTSSAHQPVEGPQGVAEMPPMDGPLVAPPAKVHIDTLEKPAAPEPVTPVTVSEEAPPAVTDEALEGPYRVSIRKDERGASLQVDGVDLMVIGMNWGHMPVGENYTYSLWSQEEAFIKQVIDVEMALLKDMGVNAIRQMPGIPPKWVTYIYETFGIYTVMNHVMGRYGFSIDGIYVAQTNYQDPRTREVLTEAVLRTMLEVYADTPGILMWLLGNENNYGLSWSSFEIEALPTGEQHKARAVHLYTLYGQIVDAIKARGSRYPVGIANGDLQFLDLVKAHVPNLDVMGSNVYRGVSSKDLFSRVWEELRLPVMYTEFGSDAYNAKDEREDHVAQAYYLHGQWREIYEQSHGKGGAGNAIGGLIFQWADGWWKYKQVEDLEVHDTHASWPNGGYPHDFVEGQNNMNEEWFGICAKGPRDKHGHTPLYPRTAYYVLKEAFGLDPYAKSTSKEVIARHFGGIEPKAMSLPYELSQVDQRLTSLSWVRAANLRMVLDTYVTGGSHLGPGLVSEREAVRFDHLESFWLDFTLQPNSALQAKLSVHAQANSPANRVDEIFWESDNTEPVRIYNASVTWDDEWFVLEAFYREGHYHWAYEGDYWGFYREAFYGPNIDLYKGTAPFGFTMAGKRALQGLTLAFGPELWWGANPALLAKYNRQFGLFAFSLVHQEDIAEQERITSTAGVPEPLTRRTGLWLKADLSPAQLELGALFSGSEKVGDAFLSARPATGRPTFQDSGYDILSDEVRWQDTLGAKARLSLRMGPVQWRVEGGYQGLVANAGSDQAQNPGGWTLKPSGRGNQWHVFSGLNVELGAFKLAPAVLYQRPLEGPMPAIGDFYSESTDTYYPGMRARNVLDDPFAVRENREQLAFELRLTYDPTPGTWFFAWDNVLREDAAFAASLDVVYRMQPTVTDGGLAFDDAGVNIYGFPVGSSALDVWDVTFGWRAHPEPALRMAGNLFVGQNQARGPDPRLVLRGGGDVNLSYRHATFGAALSFNDWGPYDYHKDFNLTFPVQLRTEAAYALGFPRWLGERFSRFGIQFQMRWLDEHSPRIDLDEAGDDWGTEWEVRTFMEVTL
jgi:beta-galactosidase